jgi:hypothetical protein
MAPIPFDPELCRIAAGLKAAGLPWTPHPGCFVWDPDGHIPAPSPFPGRVYFILSLPRFIDIFNSAEAVGDRLVWLPTWYQARRVCQLRGISPPAADSEDAATDLKRLYLAIGESLRT